MKGGLFGPTETADLYKQLVGIMKEGDLQCDLETFIGISDDKRFCTGGEYKFAQLPNSCKDEMISKLKALKFLNSLLKEGNRGESNSRFCYENTSCKNNFKSSNA